MYHLVALPVKVLYKSLNRILSSTNKFEEHHKWYIMTCLEGSSSHFPSIFGILDGNDKGISSHKVCFWMESLLHGNKSERYKVSKKENGVLKNWFGVKWNVACDHDGPCSPPILLRQEVLGPPNTLLFLEAWGPQKHFLPQALGKPLGVGPDPKLVSNWMGKWHLVLLGHL